MEIEIIDTISHIKKNPKMYLGKEEIGPDELSTIIANDAIVLGASLVSIKILPPWFIVAADIDWLSIGHDKSVDEIFVKMLPLIGAGLNALRREPILMAFAENIAIATGRADFKIIKGSLKGVDANSFFDAIDFMDSAKRILVFSCG